MGIRIYIGKKKNPLLEDHAAKAPMSACCSIYESPGERMQTLKWEMVGSGTEGKLNVLNNPDETRGKKTVHKRSCRSHERHFLFLRAMGNLQRTLARQEDDKICTKNRSFCL